MNKRTGGIDICLTMVCASPGDRLNTHAELAERSSGCGGAADLRTGVADSVFNLACYPALNHCIKVKSGVLAEECSDLLRRFFQSRRK